MWSKRAILLCVVLIGLGVHRLSADDAKIGGGHVLAKEWDRLYVMDPDGTNRQKIAEKVEAAARSRDGNLVAYADHQGVHVLSLADGQSVTVAALAQGDVNSLAWSPDHKLLAYDVAVPMKSWDLFVAAYPPSGGAPRNLGHWYETMSFSPNGKFIVHPAEGNILETVNVETGKSEAIYKASSTLWDAEYAPDGRSIAFRMAKAAAKHTDDDEPECGGPEIDLWILPLDSKKPVKIMDGVFDFDWSPDGRFLAISKGTEDCGYPPGDAAVFISSVDGKDQFQLSTNAPSVNAKFSPDSKKVIFVEFDGARFWIGDISTRKLTRVPGPGTPGDVIVACAWK